MIVDQVVQASLFGQRHHRRQPPEGDQVRVVENRLKAVADSHYECSCQWVELNCRKSYSSLSQEHSPSRHTHHPGGSRLSAWCGGYENLVEIHARAVQALLESPIVTSVKMMPHDLRNPETTGDIALCTAIIQRLEGAPKSLTMEVPRDALHARAILSSAEVVLTARMHAAIGALCETRPILLVGYQGKAEGLLEAFELNSQLLTPESLDDLPALHTSGGGDGVSPPAMRSMRSR